jgi:membrane-associated protease RseP (regulator of RpoE activity)
MFLPSISAWPDSPGHFSYYWYELLNDLLFVNFYWGLVNLLPVYPLDGGHAARAIFEQRDGFRGRRNSLILSTAVAAAVALASLVSGSLFRAVLFGVMAVSSAQALAAAPHSAPRPSWSWR